MVSKILMFLIKDKVLQGTVEFMKDCDFTVEEVVHVVRSSSEYSVIKKESIWNITGEY